MRGTVNQLLAELDGVRDGNEGLFVLAATNLRVPTMPSALVGA